MENNQAIKFLMKRIEVEQFATLSDRVPADPSNVSFGINLAFSVDIKEHIVVCKMNSIFKEAESPFMKLDTKCYFVIEPTAWKSFNPLEDKITIPTGFLRHIATHSIGTSRGILHVKTESTPFNSYIIPPINVNDLIKADLKIK